MVFGGKIKSYFEHIVRPNKDIQPTSTCFRQRDGNVYCSGNACYTVDLFISLPIVLLFEAFDHDDWDFPQRLQLLPKCQDIPDGLHYTLTGRVLSDFDQSHYTVRLRNLHGSQVYEYDDMASQDCGFTRRNPGSSIRTHLFGTDSSLDLPEGKVTAFAVYYLEGGVRSQEAWLKHQTKVIKEKYYISLGSEELQNVPRVQCTMDGPGITEIPPSERVWMADVDNTNIHSRDYLRISSESGETPRKRKQSAAKTKPGKGKTIQTKRPRPTQENGSQSNRAVGKPDSQAGHGAFNVMCNIFYPTDQMLCLAPLANNADDSEDDDNIPVERSLSPLPLNC